VHTDTKQGFVDAKMATNRAAMKDIEDEVAQRAWNDDEKKQVS
jgi:hypothetical protein